MLSALIVNQICGQVCVCHLPLGYICISPFTIHGSSYPARHFTRACLPPPPFAQIHTHMHSLHSQTHPRRFHACTYACTPPHTPTHIPPSPPQPHTPLLWFNTQVHTHTHAPPPSSRYLFAKLVEIPTAALSPPPLLRMVLGPYRGANGGQRGAAQEPIKCVETATRPRATWARCCWCITSVIPTLLVCCCRSSCIACAPACAVLGHDLCLWSRRAIVSCGLCHVVCVV